MKRNKDKFNMAVCGVYCWVSNKTIECFSCMVPPHYFLKRGKEQKNQAWVPRVVCTGLRCVPHLPPRPASSQQGPFVSAPLYITTTTTTTLPCTARAAVKTRPAFHRSVESQMVDPRTLFKTILSSLW